MKRFLFFLILLFNWQVNFAQLLEQPTPTEQAPVDETIGFLAYNGDFHNDVIAPQVKACQEVAKVMYPRVCDDTETEWAAQYADSLANDLLAKKELTHGEQLARLYEIENVICYGMSYFSAIIGAPINPEAAQESLTLMQHSYADVDSLKSVNFKSPKLLIEFEQSVYFNFGDFMILGTRYSDGDPQFVTNNIEMNLFNYACVSYLFQFMKNDTQAYRYSTHINNTSFFMTFCPLAFWLAGEEFQQAHLEEYLKIGGWFDEKAAPVISALQSGSINLLTPISDEEYSSFLKHSAEYRAQLISLFAKGINTIPLETQ